MPLTPEQIRERKHMYDRRLYARKLGLTLEEYEARKAERSTANKTERERRLIYDRRAYAKKLGITVEQLEARLQARKQTPPKKRRKKPVKKVGLRDSELQRLREKHKAFEGTRLSESINKPEYLNA